MTFQPGQSGNAGRKKRDTPGKLAAMLKLEGAAEKAADTLIKYLDSPADAVGSAKQILDRVLGTPTQSIDAKVSGDVNILVTIERWKK